MQIRAITVSAAGMTGERNVRNNELKVQPEENVFGAECKVTISQEGRKLSRKQQVTQTEKSLQDMKTVRLLQQCQEETEQEKGIKDGYREELDAISKKVSDLNRSDSKTADKDEAIEKQQEVLRAMRNQKAFQKEQNEKRAKEAQQMAMKSAGYKEEVDANNRDLLTLLKTMREAEKAGDERESGEMKDNSKDAGSVDAINSVGDVIRNSSTQFMMSSIKREWSVEEAITGLREEGRQHLKLADTVTQNMLNEIKSDIAAIDDALYTDEQINEMRNLLLDGMSNHELAEGFRERGWKTGLELNYDDIENNRSQGMQNLRDALDLRLWNYKINPLGGMQQTKKSMMLTASDVDLGEAGQNVLGETSRKLAEEVKDLIDERNDVDRIPEEERPEEEEEEQEERLEELQEQQAAVQEKAIQPGNPERPPVIVVG